MRDHTKIRASELADEVTNSLQSSAFSINNLSSNLFCICLYHDSTRNMAAYRRLYNTSGARDMIFINCLALSSRATGPNILVPTGSI